jgi:hypothetical protein
METLLAFAATSFTRPSDLDAIELAAAAAVLAWGAIMLGAARLLGRMGDSKSEEPARYDEAA